MVQQNNIFSDFSRRGRRWGRWGAAALVALSACARNPVTQRAQTKVISEKTERAIGAETRVALLKEYGELKDPVLTQYVTNIGRRLVAVSDRPRLDYVFTILDADLINAFAAPGGFIFITRGLMEAVQSEGELASVLAHEIVHIAGWHSIGMIQRQMGYGALTTLGAIASGISLGPEAMLLVSQTGQLFTDLYLLGYSREHELEADRVGLRYMLSARYDPEASLTFFERLAALEQNEGPNDWEPYLQSHPPTDARIRQAKAYIHRPYFFKRETERGDLIYQEMKGRLPRVGPEERGEVRGRRFEQTRYGVRMDIPEGYDWEAHGAHSIVAFRKKGGESFGELRREPLSAPLTPEQFAFRFAGDRKWQFWRGRSVLYPAGYGYLGQFIGPSVLGGTYIFRGLFLVRDGVGWAVLFAATPDRAFEALVPSEQVFRSFDLK